MHENQLWRELMLFLFMKKTLAIVDALQLALETRLDCRFADQVNKIWINHSTLRFTHKIIPHMAVAMCLVGHLFPNLETYHINKYHIYFPLG